LKAVDDIKDWLVDQGATAIVDSLNGPATDEIVEAAEKELGFRLPEELRAVYRTHNGQQNWDALRNTFFRHGLGGFCDLKAAVSLKQWAWFIHGPGAAMDPSFHQYPEKIVPRDWILVDRKRTRSDLLQEECSTGWLAFSWEENFAGVLHLRTGRVFEWEHDEGLTFLADSFGAFLATFADDLWNGRHRIAQEVLEDGDEENLQVAGPWQWD
jgi:hypothetical protein